MNVDARQITFHCANNTKTSLGQPCTDVRRICHRDASCLLYLFIYLFTVLLFIQTKGPWATSLTWETFLEITKLEQSYDYTSRLIKSPYYIPFKRSIAFNLHNFLKLSSTKDAFCQVWFELDQWFWRRIVLNVASVLCYFVMISLWKRECPFIWRN